LATLVHLADANNAAAIRKNGIKPGKILTGVYCMPVLPDFYASHQWLRELKAGGVKTLVAVYFKIADDEEVYIRKLGGKHRRMLLSLAIKEIWDAEDKSGYELILAHKIPASQITAIKSLPQQLGWRHSPNSHGTKPCNCEFCLKGTIKGKRTKIRLDKIEQEKP
jgi:hypothetical protein